ncbi:MAG: hypothetical protein QM743_07505 [Chitinophagaceae bacterium]
MSCFVFDGVYQSLDENHHFRYFRSGRSYSLYYMLPIPFTHPGARQDHINHEAHLWGGVFGFVFTFIFDPTHGQLFLQQILKSSIVNAR